MPRFECRRLLPLHHAAPRYAIDPVTSPGGGRQRGAARTAKAGSRLTGLSASAAEKARPRGGWGIGSRLCRNRDQALLLRRECPDQRDNPPDKGPTGKQIQDKDSSEVGPFAGQKSGKKIKKQGNERENRVEMEKGHKTQRRDQHGARSAKTHGVFYHGLSQLRAAVSGNGRPVPQGLKPVSCYRHLRADLKIRPPSRYRLAASRDGRPGILAGTHRLAAEHASCVFPSDVFYCQPRGDGGLSLLRQPWSPTTAAEIIRKCYGRASFPATSLVPTTRPLGCNTFGSGS